MTLFNIDVIQKLPIPIPKAWDFFSNPRNLEIITPPWLDLRITSEITEEIYPGMIITYDLTPFLGISLDWVTEIKHVVRPNLFVDEQRFGPYRFWHHKHLFREIPGGIEMRDIVHYAFRFGLLGKFAGTFFVSDRVSEIFNFRHEKLKELFGELS